MLLFSRAKTYADAQAVPVPVDTVDDDTHPVKSRAGSHPASAFADPVAAAATAATDPLVSPTLLADNPSNSLSSPVNIDPNLHQQTLPHERLHQFNHLTDPVLLIDQSLRTVTSTDFPIDPALGGSIPSETDPHISTPVAQFHHHELTQQYPISSPTHPPIPVDPAVDPPMGTEEVLPGPSSVSKRGSVSEDSDQELKRLAAENADIPLKELASRVREDENGPKAERARQILGMRWLLTSCERASDTTVAVPRNRVYARYVSMCANERIKPLNPASFGKLVRLMYPEIKTRRLGVRGHSKYHYCGIKLKGDPSSPTPKVSQGSASGSEPPPQMSGEDHLHVLTPSYYIALHSLY